MTPMNLPVVFEIASALAEAAVLGLLTYRRVWRTLPVFYVYCVCALVSDSTASLVKGFTKDGYGINIYLISTALDYTLQFCVLVELAWAVLRPVRARLSNKALVVVAAAILAAGAAIWPFTRIAGLVLPSGAWHTLLQLEQTVSILRIVFFVLLAGCCHLLSMGWRDRELQVATGFGFYSLVSLAVAVLNTHLVTITRVTEFYWIVAFSFLFSLFYWVFAFAQTEEVRREFTPQMESVLLTVARSAHLARGGLRDVALAGKDRG